MRFRTSLIATSLVFAVAACGASGSSDGSASTTEPAPATTEAPPTTGGDEPTTTGVDEPTTEVDPAPSGDADEYTASLAIGFENPSGGGGELSLDGTEAGCIAPVWVDVIDAGALADAGVSPQDLEDPDFDFSELGLDEDQATAMIDAFDGCDIDLYQRFLDSLGDGLDATEQSCLADELSEDLSRELLITALSTNDLPADLSQEFDRIGTTCGLDG